MTKKNVILFFPRPWPGRGVEGRLPFSLLHLYSYLKNEEFNIVIADERVIPDMRAFINELDDDILCFGISSFTGIQIYNGLRIAGLLKERFHDTPLVWGGWHPSCLPEQTLQNPFVDIVVRNQGEETFRQLLHALAGHRSLSGLEGISYKQGAKIFHNPVRQLLPVLETLKLSYDIIDVAQYIFKTGWADRTIGIITSLGCPFSCGFCAVASVYKKKTFFRNLDYVMEEIDYLVERYNINGLTIDDDNFFVSKSRVIEFCEKLLSRPYRLAWDAGAHVGLLLKNYDDATLRLVKESGCKQLYIGAESGSEEVMERINKKATVRQTFEYVEKMRKHGIKSFLSTVVCFPGVTSEDIYATMDMILKCRDIDPNLGFRLFYYTPYPATPLYESALQLGMKEPQSLEEWSNHTLRKFKAPWISEAYRRQVRYFVFYYFPYSAAAPITYYDPAAGLPERVLKKLYMFIFENRLLRFSARWRLEKSFFKFPVDAYFVMKGQFLKGLYIRHVKKEIDSFNDYED